MLTEDKSFVQVIRRWSYGDVSPDIVLSGVHTTTYNKYQRQLLLLKHFARVFVKKKVKERKKKQKNQSRTQAYTGRTMPGTSCSYCFVNNGNPVLQCCICASSFHERCLEMDTDTWNKWLSQSTFFLCFECSCEDGKGARTVFTRHLPGKIYCHIRSVDLYVLIWLLYKNFANIKYKNNKQTKNFLDFFCDH